MSVNLTIPYSARDPIAALAALKSQLAVETGGDWTDFTLNDLGTALVDTQVQINDFNAFFVDQQTAETFLSTCSLRESAIRRAKELNYIPARATSATCTALISFPAFGAQTIVPAGTLWSINGITFVCADEILIAAGQTSAQISLSQGTIFSQTATIPGTSGGPFIPWYKITVPRNVAGLSVSVNNVVWTEIDSFMDVEVATSYKVYENITGQTILFGANIGTVALKPADSVVLSALLTQGAFGNIEPIGQGVLPISIIRDNNGNTVNQLINGTTLTSANGGLDVEGIESIKTNAPKFFSTQGRAVTTGDYAVFLGKIAGLTDFIVIPGQQVQRYGDVLIIAYGQDVYNVTSDFLSIIQSTLTKVNCLTATAVVQAPTVVQVAEYVTLGLTNASLGDLSTPTNAENTAITQFYTKIHIGNNMRGSARDAAAMAVSGVVYANCIESLSTFVTSSAGAITIPLILNPDLTNCTLVDADGNVLFSGDGTAKNINGNFQFLEAATFPDQQCTLTYAANSQDILVSPYQVIVLQSLNITTELVAD